MQDVQVDKELPRARKSSVEKYLKLDGVEYLLRNVVCGRRCQKCPHGPYWYIRVKTNKKEREIYVGKVFRTLAEFNLIQKKKREVGDFFENTKGNNRVGQGAV